MKDVPKLDFKYCLIFMVGQILTYCSVGLLLLYGK